MPVVGFTYTKILVEKKSKLDPTKDKILNNVNLVNVEEERHLDKQQALLNFHFNFSVEYGKSAKMVLEGVVLYANDKKNIEKVLSDWNNDRKLDADLSSEIFNTILFKCNIKGLQLADDLNLPAHFRIPLLRKKPEEMTDKSKK